MWIARTRAVSFPASKAWAGVVAARAAAVVAAARINDFAVITCSPLIN
jgi:hypothetical protein